MDLSNTYRFILTASACVALASCDKPAEPPIESPAIEEVTPVPQEPSQPVVIQQPTAPTEIAPTGPNVHSIDGFYTLTNNDGNSIDARLLYVEDPIVYIRRQNTADTKIAIDQLNADSRELVQAWAQKFNATVTTQQLAYLHNLDRPKALQETQTTASETEPFSSQHSNAQTYEWDKYKVPAKAEKGHQWELVDLSNDFNYSSNEKQKSNKFTRRWKSGFINPWTGPGKTIWSADHYSIEDGLLSIPASRKPGTEDIVLTGCISTEKTVVYPVYVEVRAKMNKLTLASCAWMLSGDSTQEIDILEAYGSDRPGQEWFADRLHLSHHVFIRKPFQDYQPSDDGSWYKDGTLWSKKFHRIGVYWRDPWHLEYYVDGKHVRTTSGEDMIDPRGYTGGTGLVKPMHLIINVENQDWRIEGGAEPTDKELLDEDKNTYLVDWIRVYKPVATERF